MDTHIYEFYLPLVVCLLNQQKDSIKVQVSPRKTLGVQCSFVRESIVPRGDELDPNRPPWKVTYKESHPSPSPSYCVSRQRSFTPQSSSENTLSGKMTFRGSEFVVYGFELLVRVWFVSIVLVLVPACFFGWGTSWFHLYIFLLCIIYLNGTWWVSMFLLVTDFVFIIVLVSKTLYMMCCMT
jgi:hypothetical protein